MTIDLIRRLAALHGQDAGDDPASWYRDRLDGEPDYSNVLEKLAPTLGDRRNLLSSYFEPTQQEREDGLKVPTRAHRAIAGLVADRFVKVIVTTNFDRLLETALAEAGVDPTVVSSPSSAEGALPIAHSRCTIIKVHGDYLSPDLKNTVEELAGYDPSIDRLLDEVFDQYGLVVCGWSGIWDTALRNAILRASNRRFAAYWLHRGRVSPEAEQIIGNRGAVTMTIQDADSAMEDLLEKVRALEDAADKRPGDTAVAVAQLKRYLPDPIHRIRLHELVTGEVNAAIEQIQGLPTDPPFVPQAYAKRMATYEQAMSATLKVLTVGAFFSDMIDHNRLWASCISLLATRNQQRSGLNVLINMQQYPTLLALYGLALGSLAANKIDPIAHALAEVSVQEHRDPEPVAVAAASMKVLDYDAVNGSLYSSQPLKTPISDHILNVVGPAASSIVSDQARLEDLFDEVEYLMGVAYMANGYNYGPHGRAAWRSFASDRYPGSLVKRHAQGLVLCGVFDSEERMAQALDDYDEALRSSPIRWR